MYMNTTETEKDWLRRICGQKPSDTAEKQVRKVAKEAVEQNPTPLKKKGNGFGDVAGMNELKQRVTEGFINVLQNRECAEVYGIKPPSMLFTARQDVENLLCGEDGRGGRHQFHEDRSR